jgi:hypothetical protein
MMFFIYLLVVDFRNAQIRLYSFILLGFSNNSNAQFGFSHEVGVIAGPVAFQSDYGSDITLYQCRKYRMGIGIIHYINFSYKAECYTPDTYFNDHFKLRSELSYNKTNLEHLGQWVAPDKTD